MAYNNQYQEQQEIQYDSAGGYYDANGIYYDCNGQAWYPTHVDEYGVQQYGSEPPQQEEQFSLKNFYGGGGLKSKNTASTMHQPVAEAQDEGFNMQDYLRGGAAQKSQGVAHQPVAEQEDGGFNMQDYLRGGKRPAAQQPAYQDGQYDQYQQQEQYQQQDQYQDNSGQYQQQEQYYQEPVQQQSYQQPQYQNEQNANVQQPYYQQQAPPQQQEDEGFNYADFMAGGKGKSRVLKGPAQGGGCSSSALADKMRERENQARYAQQAQPQKSALAQRHEQQQQQYQQPQQYQQQQQQPQQYQQQQQYQQPAQQNWQNNQGGGNYQQQQPPQQQQQQNQGYYGQQQSYDQNNAPATQQKVKSDYVSPYSRQQAAQEEQKQGAQTNDFYTEVAGDVAVNAIEQNLTAENINASKQYATKENAETAWEGAKWADNKADEMGIDKQEVACKAGSAAWKGLSSIDYGKLANNM